MSYLDVPRLHFAGNFTANISTVNNTPENYNPTVANPNPLWNPDGSGNWGFNTCTVQRVCYADGTVSDDPAADPIIGAPVEGISSPSAKLVDLDPQQQLVSEVWGFNLRIGSNSNSVAGDYEVAAFSDLWRRALSGGGDFSLSAFYQSILTSLKWGLNPKSRFLKEWKAASPKALSIKFMVDGFSPNGMQGRVVGTIGPDKAGEPNHFVASRLLRPGSPSPLYFAPCRVDAKRRVVLLDLGNSIPTTTPGGPPPKLGDLQLAILPRRRPPILLGKIKYSGPLYTKTAFIQEFPVTAAQLQLLAETPLGVVQHNPSGAAGSSKTGLLAPDAVFLQENSLGTYVRADQFVFRLNPGDKATVNLYATRFGKPARNQPITLSYASNRLRPGSPPTVGTPQSALTFPSQTKPTNNRGRVAFALKASDPGNPRKFIDGQVYGVGYTWGVRQNADPSDFISVLVHNNFTYTGAPTWKDDVEPIFSQYAKLYPFMKKTIGIDLADYDSVWQHQARIVQTMKLLMVKPAYMPVVRDLSSTKRTMILKWFADGMPRS